MRTVELRRHAERDANEELTANGLAQYARARETLEFPYDAYVISPAKRARLTMEAFGGKASPSTRGSDRGRDRRSSSSIAATES